MKQVYYWDMDGVLIDDDEKNTKQWVKAGYEALLLTTKGQKISL